MPTFGKDCWEMSGADRKVCSDKALMTFIYGHISYPAPARENGIEGKVVLSFVVETDGSISDIKTLRGVGGGCTEMAISALEAINNEKAYFRPGIQNEARVRVRFTMPIQFELN
ncbi:energy transducer TonB [Lewinella sp. 4G2]|uniref:energy transducer TonB n=1 Tax=Lewinella sp. 4G2 TaxID=1803372 RepID=UPI0007B4A4D9|nr:energy transducer TonB [Lewinella sp. 4G2]OAV44432.1 hypothetical protein A3850_007965 [Lewinella sp. 4G2]